MDGNFRVFTLNANQLLTFKMSFVCNRKWYIHINTHHHRIFSCHFEFFLHRLDSQSEIESPYKSFIAFYEVIWDDTALIRFQWNPMPIISNPRQINNWFLFDGNYYFDICVLITLCDRHIRNNFIVTASALKTPHTQHRDTRTHVHEHQTILGDFYRENDEVCKLCFYYVSFIKYYWNWNREMEFQSFENMIVNIKCFNCRKEKKRE